jgi:DNA-binding GntR family transcriptional regulator
MKIVDSREPAWYTINVPITGIMKIKVSAIRDAVADGLRQALLDGRFKPGEELPEVAIAAEFDVSRGPVREAMLLLAAEGLITHTQNKGFSVLNFTARDLQQIESVRIPLDALALANARRNITEGRLEQLEAARSLMSSRFEAGDTLGSIRAEIDFHGLIWEISGNPWLTASLKRIMTPAYTYGTAFRLDGPPLNPLLLHELHGLYIDYLKGTSPHSAEQCVRLHLGLPPSAARTGHE